MISIILINLINENQNLKVILPLNVKVIILNVIIRDHVQEIVIIIVIDHLLLNHQMENLIILLEERMVEIIMIMNQMIKMALVHPIIVVNVLVNVPVKKNVMDIINVIVAPVIIQQVVDTVVKVVVNVLIVDLPIIILIVNRNLVQDHHIPIIIIIIVIIIIIHVPVQDHFLVQDLVQDLVLNQNLKIKNIV